MLGKRDMCAVRVLEDELLSAWPLVVALRVLDPLDSHLFHLHEARGSKQRSASTSAPPTYSARARPEKEGGRHATHRTAVDANVAAAEILCLAFAAQPGVSRREAGTPRRAARAAAT